MALGVGGYYFLKAKRSAPPLKMLMSSKMASVTMSLFMTSSTIASVKLCVESLDHFFFG